MTTPWHFSPISSTYLERLGATGEGWWRFQPVLLSSSIHCSVLMNPYSRMLQSQYCHSSAGNGNHTTLLEIWEASKTDPSANHQLQHHGMDIHQLGLSSVKQVSGIAIHSTDTLLGVCSLGPAKGLSSEELAVGSISGMSPSHKQLDPPHGFPVGLILREGLVRVGDGGIQFIRQFTLLHKNTHRGSVGYNTV